jgi:predicted DCC family thiol-disulfide oxidoreductase YuxK
MSTGAGAVILFDGVCNLCNGIVRFVIARDPRGVFQFGALQSPAAERVLASLDPPLAPVDSLVLIEGGKASVRSTGALRILRRLRFPWPMFYGLIVVPRPIRDWVYDLIARRRYGWFGRQDVCMVPRPDLANRFVK